MYLLENTGEFLIFYGVLSNLAELLIIFRG